MPENVESNAVLVEGVEAGSPTCPLENFSPDQGVPVQESFPVLKVVYKLVGSFHKEFDTLGVSYLEVAHLPEHISLSLSDFGGLVTPEVHAAYAPEESRVYHSSEAYDPFGQRAGLTTQHATVFEKSFPGSSDSPV